MQKRWSPAPCSRCDFQEVSVLRFQTRHPKKAPNLKSLIKLERIKAFSTEERKRAAVGVFWTFIGDPALGSAIPNPPWCLAPTGSYYQAVSCRAYQQLQGAYQQRCIFLCPASRASGSGDGRLRSVCEKKTAPDCFQEIP